MSPYMVRGIKFAHGSSVDNQLTLNRESSLNYLGGTNVITKVLKW